MYSTAARIDLETNDVSSRDGRPVWGRLSLVRKKNNLLGHLSGSRHWVAIRIRLRVIPGAHSDYEVEALQKHSF